MTLAAFLGLQGILLQIIGEGGTIRIQSDTVLAIMTKNLPVWLGWALFVVVMLGYAAVTTASWRPRASRRAARPDLGVGWSRSSRWRSCSASAPTT